MGKYFYTFGTSLQFPYQRGWVEIHAESSEEANKKFRSRFPDVNPGTLNCAFVYTEEQWNKMEPEKNWHGWKCHEIIE